MGVPKHEFDIDALAPNAERPGGAGSKLTWQAVLICFALFAAAPLFAVLTWQESYTWLAIRHYSVVIWAAQLIVACLVIVSGVRAKTFLDDLTGVAKIALVAFLGATAFATWSATAMPSAALNWFVITAVHLVFLAACYHAFANKMIARSAVLWSLAAGAAGYFILTFGLALHSRTIPDFNWPQFGAGVSNVRQVGYYGLAAAGISAGLLASARSRRDTLAAALLLTLGAWCVFWSGGRAATGGLLLAVIIVAVPVGWAVARRYAAISFGCLTTGALLSLTFVPGPQWGIGSILFRLAETTGGKGYSSGRTEMWIETIQAIQMHPITGHGQGQFRVVVEAAAGKYNHPHNSPLQFLFDWGILGTAAIALFAFAVLRATPSAVRTHPTLALPAIGAASSLAGMSMLDGALYYPYPIMIVLVSCAIILSIKPERTSHV